jgi:hypothetical protein
MQFSESSWEHDVANAIPNRRARQLDEYLDRESEHVQGKKEIDTKG